MANGVAIASTPSPTGCVDHVGPVAMSGPPGPPGPIPPPDPPRPPTSPSQSEAEAWERALELYSQNTAAPYQNYESEAIAYVLLVKDYGAHYSDALAGDLYLYGADVAQAVSQSCTG